VIVATGPLTSPSLAEAIARLTGEDSLAFFDAIAPIVHFESIDQSIAWFQSRYDKAGRAARAPTISTARWTRRSTRPS
jgi:methylenetetrahydrofolate--tRNA-(uracil-5-)-methyltransferase